jgi:hypothetical protein
MARKLEDLWGRSGARGSALAAALILPLTVLSLSSGAGARAKNDRQETGENAGRQALTAYRALPLAFVQNDGQLDRRVLYSAQLGDLSVFLTRREAVLAVAEGTRGLTLRLAFLGASPEATITGAARIPGNVNYLIGNDPARWRANLPTYEQVVYRNLWPGIDLAVRGRAGQLKYEFRLAPRVDPSRILLAYSGQERVSLGRNGSLRIQTSLGVLRDAPPASYQLVDGTRVAVASRFEVGQSGAYGFALGPYDRRYPLVIDPGLVYSTFVGATGDNIDTGYAIAVDGAGSAYITGDTNSRNFPTKAGAFDRKFGADYEAFVTKLNVARRRLAYSTFLGGTGNDAGYAITVGEAGNAYVTGDTDSKNFPATEGAFDASQNGKSDAFVTKLNASGSALIYSTFLGGAGVDVGGGIAIDATGNAFVAGGTGSRTFPKTSEAFDRAFNGGSSDAFVTKLSNSGSSLAYSTYLGGAGGDGSSAIAVDRVGNAYVTGGTGSINFPTTARAFDRSHNGQADVFVAKLNTAGSDLSYSTYLGGDGGKGAGGESGSGIAVDEAGSAYIAGRTTSRNFPTTPSAVDRRYKGRSGEGFVTKLNPAGSALAYSTFLGGSHDDDATAIALDGAGRAYVVGETLSMNFPTTARAFDRSIAGPDAFMTALNATGSGLAYSTYLGGEFNDRAFGIVVPRPGRVYVVGDTASENFPTTARAFDRRLGSWDAFVAILTGR